MGVSGSAFLWIYNTHPSRVAGTYVEIFKRKGSLYGCNPPKNMGYMGIPS